jgi:hypothetical protein
VNKQKNFICNQTERVIGVHFLKYLENTDKIQKKIMIHKLPDEK